MSLSPKFYSPLAIWPWLWISPHSCLNVIYCLIITTWQWLRFTYTPCIPMQINPNKSPLRNRFLALLLWEISYLSSPSRSCLGRFIFICGGWGALRQSSPTLREGFPGTNFKNYNLSFPIGTPCSTFFCCSMFLPHAYHLPLRIYLTFL